MFLLNPVFIITKEVIYSLNISFIVNRVGKRPGCLQSVTFSPTEPSVIAVAGDCDGTQLFDIRNLKRLIFIMSFFSSLFTHFVQF